MFNISEEKDENKLCKLLSDRTKSGLRMNFKKRSLIFVTFFVSCFCISLLGAALGTEHWVEAGCRREGAFSEKSNGTVNFGLFQGSRHLNSGLGNRYYPMNMLQILYR